MLGDHVKVIRGNLDRQVPSGFIRAKLAQLDSDAFSGVSAAYPDRIQQLDSCQYGFCLFRADFCIVREVFGQVLQCVDQVTVIINTVDQSLGDEYFSG